MFGLRSPFDSPRKCVTQARWRRDPIRVKHRHFKVRENVMKRLCLACCLMTAATAAWAADTCTVNDPTGTPLNVRANPNGAILGALHNGVEVRVLDTTRAGGREWAYIAPVEGGKRGWVFRNFLDCP